MNMQPPTRPFDGIYRAFPDAKHPAVERIIGVIASQGRSVTVLRVREAMDLPTAPVAAAPAPVVPPEASVAVHLARVSAVVAYRKPDHLPGKIARCANHAGLTEAEEAYSLAMHRRFPDWGYLPSMNRWQSTLAALVPPSYENEPEPTFPDENADEHGRPKGW